ncbi:MAG: hypothetical protein AAF206_12765 [Bacteroidota bacterium]
MNRLLVSFSFLISFLTLQAQTSTTYFSDGSLRAVYPINQQGMYDGTAVTYFSDGAVESETPYRSGMRDGTEKSYYENGILRMLREWKQDRKDGRLLLFHKNGRMTLYARMVEDSLQFAQRFDEEGRLVNERILAEQIAIDRHNLADIVVMLPGGQQNLLVGRPNAAQIFLPRVPSAYLRLTSPNGSIRRQEHPLYPYLLTPHSSKEAFILYPTLYLPGETEPIRLKEWRIQVK